MESQVLAARSAGLNYIAFTEHEDYNPGDYTSFYFDHHAYWHELRRLRPVHANDIYLAAGVEISEPHQHPARVASLLANYPWDVVIGSLHWVDKMHNCYLPEWVKPFGGWRVAMRAYWTEMQQLAAEGDFDILAHIDYPARYLHIPQGDRYDIAEFEDVITPVLKQVIARNKAIEINTNPLRRGKPSGNPPAIVVQWYVALGGRLLTLGSDSHAPAHIGAHLETARAIAQQAGIRDIACFFQRRATLARLETA